MSAKILVVDDDKVILSILRRFLTGAGYAVISADNGSEGLMLVRESRPDLILLDADMPGLDGHAVCRLLKKDPATQAIPVVIMSGSRLADSDVLSGYAGGSDDYVAKPFALPLLAARLEAILRRYKRSPQAPEAKLTRSGIELDLAGRAVKVSGRAISLTRKEFDLLAILMDKAGRALSVPFLLETVWGYDPSVYYDPGTVEVHISHLRKKLGPKAAKKIINLTGHGYKFEV